MGGGLSTRRHGTIYRYSFFLDMYINIHGIYKCVYVYVHIYICIYVYICNISLNYMSQLVGVHAVAPRSPGLGWREAAGATLSGALGTRLGVLLGPKYEDPREPTYCIW